MGLWRLDWRTSCWMKIVWSCKRTISYQSSFTHRSVWPVLSYVRIYPDFLLGKETWSMASKLQEYRRMSEEAQAAADRKPGALAVFPRHRLCGVRRLEQYDAPVCAARFQGYRAHRYQRWPRATALCIWCFRHRHPAQFQKPEPVCKCQWKSLPVASEKVYHSANELVYHLLLNKFTTLVQI